MTRHAWLLVTHAAFCWLAMQAAHEAGHVAGAWLTGGTVERVVLSPFELSRTDLGANPRPLLVAWAGPVLGVLLPLAAFGAASLARMPHGYLLRSFSAFCLIANGMYIGAGSFWRAADAGDLLHYGSPQWLLLLFGLCATSGGFFFYNGLGPSFGLERPEVRIEPGALAISAALLGATLAAFAIVAIISGS